MSVLSRRLALFGLLSLADLTLTCLLLQHSDGDVYESNPLARQFLAWFGWAGLAGFKMALVLLCATVCLVISRRRPQVARRVLGFGCLVLAGVVVYSCTLGTWVRAEQAAEDAANQQRESQLEAQLQRGRAYQALLSRLSADLVARRCTLAEAVRMLEQSEKGCDPEWLANLHRSYGYKTSQECLAANIICHTILSQKDRPRRARRVASRLGAAFQADYRSTPPRLIGRSYIAIGQSS